MATSGEKRQLGRRQSVVGPQPQWNQLLTDFESLQKTEALLAEQRATWMKAIQLIMAEEVCFGVVTASSQDDDTTAGPVSKVSSDVSEDQGVAKRLRSTISKDTAAFLEFSTEQAPSLPFNIRQQDLDKVEALLSGSHDYTLGHRHKVWLLLEDRESSRIAFIVHIIQSSIIFASVISNIYAMVAESNALHVIDYIFNVFFTIEIALRLVVTPSIKREFMRIYIYWDIVAVVPFFWNFIARPVIDDSPGFELMVLLVPILRLLKIARNSPNIHLLAICLRQSVFPLVVPLFFLGPMTVFFSSMLFWVEKHSTEVNVFKSIPHCMWYVLVTISTVGYGDVTPMSDIGKVFGAIVIVLGILYISMPIGIVSSTFLDVWKDRERIQLRSKAQTRLAVNGLDIIHLVMMFNVADKNRNGKMSAKEFYYFVSLFKLGISKQDVLRIFRSIDVDHSGNISFEEFALFLFPDVVHFQASALNDQDREALLVYLRKDAKKSFVLDSE